jgi:hypothetical protein
MRQANPGYPRVEVPLSKRKITLLLGFNLLVTLTGAVLLWLSSRFPEPVYGLMMVTAITGLVFFGTSVVSFTTRLLQQAPGFVVDNEGIIDQAEVASAGRVYWKEIQDLKLWESSGQSLILLQTNQAETIMKEVNLVKRLMLFFNQKRFGTPLAITCSTLDMDTHKLFKLIKENHTHLDQPAG